MNFLSYIKRRRHRASVAKKSAPPHSGIWPGPGVESSAKLKIVLLTQYYPPEMGAAPNRLSDLAKDLTNLGHSVTVLTAMPNYPTGRYYPAYGGLFRREIRNGASVIRTLIYPTKSAGLVQRLLCYFSFVFSSLALGGWLIGNPNYLITESPPLFLGISGFLLSRWKRARWIFNVSDLWPESAVSIGVLKPGLALSLAERLEAFFYRRAWLITGQSSGIVQSIRDRFPGAPTLLLSNGVDTQRFRPDCCTRETRALLGSDSHCVVLYAGLHGLAQGLEQIIEAAAQLKDEPTIKFVLIGDGPVKQELMREAACKGTTNVTFLDPLPREQMPALVAAADIVVVPLKMHIPGAVPSKLYEAMSAGRALVLVASGEPAAIVSVNRAGVVVEPGDIKALADTLRELARDPVLRERLGTRARQVALEKYDRSLAVARFARYLEDHPGTHSTESASEALLTKAHIENQLQAREP